MPISGTLDVFPAPNGRQYPYFVSGDATSSKAVIFIGGLFNGLGDVPYLPALSSALGAAGWKLVQLHWTSAYTNFGLSSLDTDVADLSALIAHLKDVSTVVLMGHSTGSQDVLHFLTRARGAAGGIMQAPVSDREHFGVAADSESKAWRAALPRAREMLAAGRGEEIVDAPGLGLRITAYRLASLLDVGGDDDYFSSDLPDAPDGIAAHPLSESFGRLSVPALALYSEKDEYAHIADPEAHLARWRAAAKGHLTTVIIKDANHAVEDAKLHEGFCNEVVGWLGKHF